VVFVVASLFSLAGAWCLLCALNPKLRRRYGGWQRGSNRRLGVLGNAAAALICFSWTIAILAVSLGHQSVVPYAFWFLFIITIVTVLLSSYDPGEPSV
jgi:hypothetical protein